MNDRNINDNDLVEGRNIYDRNGAMDIIVHGRNVAMVIMMEIGCWGQKMIGLIYNGRNSVDGDLWNT